MAKPVVKRGHWRVRASGRRSWVRTHPSAVGVDARPLRDRFMEKVRKTRGCWLWTAGTDGHGYGAIYVGPRGSSRQMRKAHRVAWELFVGPIPKGKHVLHRCDRPPCVRPSHLFIGTHVMNMADMAAKGRRRKRRA